MKKLNLKGSILQHGSVLTRSQLKSIIGGYGDYGGYGGGSNGPCDHECPVVGEECGSNGICQQYNEDKSCGGIIRRCMTS